ncbi:MAG: glycosyltransferase, partial [Verrucomicrobiae bacterium]|nr:glycosyltransferase [Verrucomicrobiae bacterium]
MRSDEASSGLVGLFHEHEEEGGVVVGRTVAVEGLLSGFSAWSERHTYAAYVPGRELARVAPRLPTGRLSVRDRAELTTSEATFAAWHDCQFDTRLPFLARSKLGGAHPITLTHHTISYKELLHDGLLRLLLAAPRPYDSIVCTSHAARRALAACIDAVAEALRQSCGAQIAYQGRYDVVPLAVDCDRFRPTDRAVARARFGIPPDRFVLLWVGRLSLIDKADLLPLVDALGVLRERHPERELLLVCAGRERPTERFGGAIADYARELGLAECVRIMDHSEFGSVAELLYGAADVFVSPIDNIQESFGLTPIEAMACGVPQIVSDWDGYRESVVHGETGFLLPTRWARCADDLSGAAWFRDSPFDHLALAQSVAVDMNALVEGVSRLIREPGLTGA